MEDIIFKNFPTKVKMTGICGISGHLILPRCRPIPESLAGFTGHVCHDIDECAGSNPCKNGNKCQNLPGSFRCLCGPGYRGWNCEEDVNECLRVRNLCGIGMCFNTLGSYHCNCSAGYVGRNCARKIRVSISC